MKGHPQSIKYEVEKKKKLSKHLGKILKGLSPRLNWTTNRSIKDDHNAAANGQVIKRWMTKSIPWWHRWHLEAKIIPFHCNTSSVGKELYSRCQTIKERDIGRKWRHNSFSQVTLEPITQKKVICWFACELTSRRIKLKKFINFTKNHTVELQDYSRKRINKSIR